MQTGKTKKKVKRLIAFLLCVIMVLGVGTQEIIGRDVFVVNAEEPEGGSGESAPEEEPTGEEPAEEEPPSEPEPQAEGSSEPSEETTPEETIPSTPEETTPDETTPSVTPGEETTPSGAPGEETTPEGTTPSGTPGEETTPEGTTPSGTPGEETTPEGTTLPGTSEETTPSETPDETTPDETTPSETPEETTPEEATEETTPEESAEEETDPVTELVYEGEGFRVAATALEDVDLSGIELHAALAATEKAAELIYEAKPGMDVAGILAYEISFTYEETGEAADLSGQATITIEYTAPELEEGLAEEATLAMFSMTDESSSELTESEGAVLGDGTAEVLAGNCDLYALAWLTHQEQAYDETWEDDQVAIHVVADAGVIPEDAELSVTPIVETEITDDMTDDEKAAAEAINEQYALTEQKLNEDSKENEVVMEGFLAYDISFFVDGEEVEPEGGSVNVTMEFKEAAIPEGVSENAEVGVKHLKKDENAEDGIAVENMEEKATVETTEKAEVQKVELTTDSFSTFTITWVNSGYTITIHYVNDKYQEIVADDIQDVVVNVDDETEINLTTYQKNIGHYTYVKTTLGTEDNAPSISAIKREGESLQYRSGYNWSYWNSTLGYHVYLVYRVSKGDENLATIETVDNNAENITLKLFNYSVEFPNESSQWRMGQQSAYGGYNLGINQSHSLKFVDNASSSGSQATHDPTNGNNWWTGDSSVKSGIVKSELNDGYPVLVYDDESLAYLFDETKHAGKDIYANANYLFTKDSDGYFSFNSDENYAEFNTDTQEFTVYSNPYSDDDYEKGGLEVFYPFNDFDDIISKYTAGEGTAYGENGNGGWGLTAGAADHYFGMTMSARYYQPKDGKINGNDMIFDFSGDDDVWVFVDNKLVLDLGGIHDKASGTINFATGQVTVNGTIVKENFYQELFSEDRFEDYSDHTINFFYLERGNNASNCKLTFNLPTIPEDAVMVSKEVTGEDDQTLDYAQDINFKFVITKKDTSTLKFNPLANTAFEIRNVDDNSYAGPGTTDSEGMFTLKDGQMAIFSDFLVTDEYEIKEIGAKLGSGYEVAVNGSEVDIENIETGDSNTLQSASTGKLLVEEYQSARFRNRISSTATLTIIKKITNDSSGPVRKQFDIQIKINGEYYKGPYSLNGSSSYTGNGIISLTPDQKANITGLPYGATFEVVEIGGDGYFAKYQLSGSYDEEKVPEYDGNGWLTNDVSSISATVAGDCEVEIENSKISGGTTNVSVEKSWDSKVANMYKQEVEVALYEGEEPDGSLTQNDSIKLNTSNNWKGEWTDLPGDKNYYVVEDTSDLPYKPVYTYTASYDFTEFNTFTPVNGASYPVGVNGIIVMNVSDGYIVWTTEAIPETYKTSVIEGLEETFKGITIANSTFASGSTSDILTNIVIEYSKGIVKLEKEGEFAGSFYIGNYSKTISVEVENNIDGEKTIDIPVKKEWEIGSNTKPGSVTVELYKKTETGEEKVKELVLNTGTSWEGSFKDLLYWDQETFKPIEYVVKETKVDNTEIENSEYQSVVEADGSGGFIITNSLAWKLVKISSSTGTDGSKIYLANAEFTASDGTNSYYGKSEEDGVIKWYEEPNHDTLIGTSLPNGNYTVTETKVPSGYQITSSGWELVIENGYPTSVKQGGSSVEYENNVFYLKNDVLYELPEAGGPGIYLYMLGGALLLMTGALMVYNERKKEVSRS